MNPRDLEQLRGMDVEKMAVRLRKYVREGAAPDDCWAWAGAKSSFGYGVLKVGRGPCVAHRIMYWCVFGAIPPGKLVLHKCDNPQCANPRHLFLGTHKDNIRDMMAKGRARFGGDHRSQSRPQKLTRMRVLEMKRLLRAGEPQARVAEAFGVSQPMVCAVAKGRAWAHVPWPEEVKPRGVKVEVTVLEPEQGS